MKRKKRHSVLALFLVFGMLSSVMFTACGNKDVPDGNGEQEVIEKNDTITYYVSPDGKDENDGLSAETPFATIEKARDAVRMRNSNMTSDIIVYLQDGVWEQAETLTFGKNDSGTNGYYVRYIAAEGANPLISGGTSLEGTWTEHVTLKNGNTIYKVPLSRDSKLRALYVNGERRYMASTERAIAAKESWGTYFIGDMPVESDYSWETVYSENFETLDAISDDSAIVAYAKSGNAKNPVLNIVTDANGNKSVQIVHTANEDCGFEIPGVTYDNAIVSCRVQFAADHKFTQDWEALHIHGANQVVDANGRTRWAGIKFAPHLKQTYFQYGTSGGNQGDDATGQQNTTAFVAKNSVWYHIKMMITQDGYYYTKIWQEGQTEPGDWSRYERFGALSFEDKFFRIYAYKNNDNSKMDIRVDDIEILAGELKTSAQGEELPEWAWATGSKFDGITYSRNDLPEITRNITDVEIENQQTWNKNTVCVREMEAGTDGTWILKLQQPYGAIAQTPGWSVGLQGSGNHIIHNAYELLDQPGEFYFDRTEQMLYYIPVEGEDINSAEVVVPRLETIVEFKGTPEVSGDLTKAGEKTIAGQVTNIVFDGVSFAYSDWNLQKVGDSYGKSTVQAGTVYTAFASDNWHGDMYRNLDTLPGAVEMEFAHNIRILNGEIKLTGAEGVLLSNDVDGCEVTGNLIYQTGGGGVVIGNPQHIYENDSLEPDVYAFKVGNGNTYIGTDGATADHEKYQNGTERVPRDIKVSNNLLLENCRLFPSHTPITLFYTQRVEVSNNLIKDAAYSGMSIGWGWCNFDGKDASFTVWGEYNNQGGSVLPGYPTNTACENKIINNRIENTMTILWDGGIIYTLGEQKGTVISGNYGSGSQHGLYQDEGSACFETIKNNVMVNLKGGNAINASTYGRKHDLHYDTNYSDSNTASVSPEVNITSDNFVYVKDGIWGKEPGEIIQNSGLTAEYKMKFADVLDELYGSLANMLLPESVTLSVGESLVLNGGFGEDTEIWLAPNGTTEFLENDTMTKVSGNADKLTVPAAAGEYRMYVKVSGEFSEASEAVVIVK